MILVERFSKSNQAAIQSFPFSYRIQSAAHKHIDEYRMCRGESKVNSLSLSLYLSNEFDAIEYA